MSVIVTRHNTDYFTIVTNKDTRSLMLTEEETTELYNKLKVFFEEKSEDSKILPYMKHGDISL